MDFSSKVSIEKTNLPPKSILLNSSPTLKIEQMVVYFILRFSGTGQLYP